MNLLNKKCAPCEGGVVALSGKKLKTYEEHLKKGWSVVREKKITKEFTFKDFEDAMYFVNKVAGIANAEGHHPDIEIHYNRVVVELWTHAIGGLSENDFILAAKIESLS